MQVGPTVRKFMPIAVERYTSRLYRSIFVDLEKVALVLCGVLPVNARVLDIGGGDGDLLNHLLERRQDLSVSMVDISPSVGKFVEPRHDHRVSLHPSTRIEQHASVTANSYDAALISDVMHHIPPAARQQFLADIHLTLRPGGCIFIKDVEPGHFISWLGFNCDRYLSGDKNVELISAAQAQVLARDSMPRHEAREIGLLSVNHPNYLVMLKFESRETTG